MTRFEDVMLLERIAKVYTQLSKDIDTLIDEYFKYFGLVNFDVDIQEEKQSVVRAITCKIDKAFLGKRDGVFEAENPSTILGQIEMLHFIRVIMGSIEDYIRGCDEECYDTVDRKEHEEG